MTDFKPPPSLDETTELVQSEFQRRQPDSNPYLENGILSALLVSWSVGLDQNFRHAKEVLNQSFVDTALFPFLTRFGRDVGVLPNPETTASGEIACTGTIGVVIGLGTTFRATDTTDYVTTVASTLAQRDRIGPSQITSFDRSGVDVRIIFADPHQIAKGIKITIANLDPVYDGEHVIEDAIGEFEISLKVADQGPIQPTIENDTSITWISSITPVESVQAGDVANKAINEILKIQDSILGVEPNAPVIFDGITGGADAQTEDDYRAEVIRVTRNPSVGYNAESIKQAVSSGLSTVDRVFVLTATPSPGSLEVLFVVKDRIAPSAIELQVVNLIVKDEGFIDPSIDPTNVVVKPPAFQGNVFVFDSLTPNDLNMQNAVTENLNSFYNGLDLGQDVKLIDVSAVITGTVDLVTGRPLQDYTLTQPGADILVPAGTLAILEQINYDFPF